MQKMVMSFAFLQSPTIMKNQDVQVPAKTLGRTKRSILGHSVIILEVQLSIIFPLLGLFFPSFFFDLRAGRFLSSI